MTNHVYEHWLHGRHGNGMEYPETKLFFQFLLLHYAPNNKSGLSLLKFQEAGIA